MTRLARLRAALVLVVAAASAGASVPGLAATLPSIYVDYTDACTFTMRADGGIAFAGSGTTIPPGTYNVVLEAPQNAPICPMDFQLQGPGVQLAWEFGGEALNANATETFLPSSSYVATDLRDSSRGHVAFATAAGGSSSSLVPQQPSTATGKGQTVPDVVGSAVPPERGVLHATVAPSGAVAVTAGGRPAASLRSGRYTVVVADRTARRGLTLRRPGGKASQITTPAFVGRKTARIVLAPGTWVFAGGGRTTARVTVVSQS